VRLSFVLLGMVLALAACSSHPTPRATAEAPIVPLVAEEEAFVASSSQPSDAESPRQRPGTTKGSRMTGKAVQP
jgi:hypothetical protein